MDRAARRSAGQRRGDQAADRSQINVPGQRLDLRHVLDDVFDIQRRAQQPRQHSTAEQIPRQAFKDQLTGFGLSEALAQGMLDMMIAKDNGLDNGVARTAQNAIDTPRLPAVGPGHPQAHRAGRVPGQGEGNNQPGIRRWRKAGMLISLSGVETGHHADLLVNLDRGRARVTVDHPRVRNAIGLAPWKRWRKPSRPRPEPTSWSCGARGPGLRLRRRPQGTGEDPQSRRRRGDGPAHAPSVRPDRHLPRSRHHRPQRVCLRGWRRGRGGCRHPGRRGRRQDRFNQADLAIMPAWGGAERLAALVGRSQAMLLVTTGEKIGTAEAHRIGLIDRVSPRADFEESGGPWQADRRLPRPLHQIGDRPRRADPHPALERSAAETFARLWTADAHWAAAASLAEHSGLRNLRLTVLPVKRGEQPPCLTHAFLFSPLAHLREVAIQVTEHPLRAIVVVLDGDVGRHIRSLPHGLRVGSPTDGVNGPFVASAATLARPRAAPPAAGAGRIRPLNGTGF